MAFTTLFLASDGGSPAEPLYTAEQIRLLVDNLFSAGVLDGFEVSERGAGANTSVDFAGGVALVEGPSTIADSSRYLVQDDAGGNTGSIGSAPGSNFRNDIICVRVHDPDAPGSSDTDRESVVTVVTGAGHTPATTAGEPFGAAGDPSLPARYLPLARVRWSVGMVSITDAQIDDLRAWATLAHDVVTDANATRLGTASPDVNSLMRRDGAGRANVEGPTADKHIANKAYVDAGPPVTGGTLDSGKIVYRRYGSGSGALVIVYTTAATAGATLPSGFRPATFVMSPARTQSPSSNEVGISTTGTIQFVGVETTGTFSVAFAAA